MAIPRNSKVYVAGHCGLVGSSLWRVLRRTGFTNLIGRTRAELDLCDSAAVRSFYERERPDYVLMAAAKVGGILANDSLPVDFLLQNMQIQNNLIEGAHHSGVRRLLFLSSSCVFPKLAPQPVKESDLLTGPLEPTNEWYALAKISGMKLCQAYRKQFGSDFISAVPNNLYGPNDNYDPLGSHVLPALIRRFHEAKMEKAAQVTCWGSGSPLREFLYVDDLATACLFLLENYSDSEIINIGSGTEISIRSLTEIVSRVVGYNGEILWDMTKPDGMPRKLLDSSRILDLGWRPQVTLEEGIRLAYADFLTRRCG